MKLQLMTWPEVEEHLARSRGLIVPIGSTEQHGPRGFLGTDALCPEIVAARVGEELEAVVAPTLAVGMAQHHLGFPGTLSLRPSTLLAVIQDVVLSAARHGFERIFFLNGHGGNIATLDAAFSEIYALESFPGGSAAVPRCRLHSWWEGERVQRKIAELFGDSEGHHGTPAELSLTYHAFPREAARLAELRPEPRIAPAGPVYSAADFRSRFPDGRMVSDSSLAEAELGELLLGEAVADARDSYAEFLAEA